MTGYESSPTKWAIIAFLVTFLILAGIVIFKGFYDRTWGDGSLEAVSKADFVLNDGYRLKTLDYSVIIDQRTGMEYLYFPGYGVTPYIDENGDVLKVVE